MIKKSLSHDWIVKSLAAGTLMLGMSMMQLASAAQITINLEDQNANPVSGFRYLVEEDTMYKPEPGVQTFNSLSFGFHRSHTPVAVGDDGKGIAGSTAGTSAVVTVPDNKNYFVSIAPYEGHALGGIDVEVTTGNVDKKVIVNTFPIPTSQISIRVFEDSSPVNGAIDLGERFLSHTIIDGQKVPFEIRLFDPAGQYGAAGGLVSQDAYGNPLGTEYDNLGNIISTPDNTNGFVLTPDANGYLVVKNLPPAKYGIEVTPPRSPDPNHPLWIQTSTIEGTRTIDAWVKANNPEQFVEFGPPGPHVFVGFVRNFDCMSGDHGILDTFVDSAGNTQTNDACAGQPAVTGGATIHGQIVDNHMSRPGPLPDPNTGQGGGFQFANGTPFDGCRVAVNIGIAGKTIYSQKCGDEATFEIDNLLPGSYSLSIWDDGLDAVIANHPFTVTGNETDGYQVSALLQNPLSNVNGSQASNIACDTMTGCDLGQIPIFNWFHKLDTVVFFDRNENGFRDCVTLTCDDPAQDDVTMHADSTATNLRFRDGRIYKSVPVDVFGEAPHDEVFPFFHWLVAEVDFANYKATGATIVVDNGGYDANLQTNGYVPQPQVGLPDCVMAPGGKGVVTSPCTWDGGLSKTETGTVLTEAFQGFLGQKNVIEFGKTNYAEGENGGITGVVVYAITHAEDDPRFAVAEEWEPGIPRVQVALYQDSLDTSGAAIVGGDKIIDDINGEPGIQLADVDNYPLGWSKDTTGTVAPGPEDIDRNGNGLFDKGDAMEVVWTDSWDDNLPTGCQGANSLPGLADDLCFDGLRNWNQIRPGVFDGGYAFSENLPAGMYIVQSYTPPGYILLKEEDKNVDFGDEYAVPQQLPPICVGEDHVVPALLSHVMDNGVQVVPGDPADYAAPYAGQTRKLCDTKQVRVADGKNAAADFHYFTQVPKAAMVVGGILNDLANEFNPNSPAFGEKFAPPWLPIAFYDFKGNEITRVYSDQFGKYNALLPSTNTVNISSPSGVAPNMVTACMNDAGMVDNPDYTVGSNLPQRIPDPNHNPQYSQFCYTLQYMPGGTTYLDTPVVPVSAFAGAGKQLDCEAGDKTPLISSVTSSDSMAGPYVANQNAALETDRMLTIRSTGIRSVLNPSSDELSHKFITRNYGFGSVEGSLQLIDEQGNSHVMLATSWTNLEITAAVPMGIADGRYQLMVTNDNGLTSPMGVTVTVGQLPLAGATVREVFPSNVAGATPIQDALDVANPGDLILVAAGRYDEIPIMYKPVHLQGAGAYSTILNARSVPAEKVQGWKNKILDLLNVKHAFSLIPGQETAELFTTEEGAGLTVVGKSFGNTKFTNSRPSGIDGFTITGASTGGGVFLNGYIQGFSISNNQITGNQGTYGGGIRLGHNTIKEEVVNDANRQFRHPDARNRNIRIHHNMITRNGVFNGAGGGIAIYTGARNYRVTNNLICGNFAATDGAGIGHLGLSSGGRIEDNTIIFNQSFRQTPGFETDGGGILIAGADNFNGTPLSAGSGSVRIDRNLIQGNQAGAGDGAGIALRRVNGDDVADNDNKPNKWWLINVRNNTIVNNVAGNAGGGISLLDAVRVNIINNTISNNESTATAGAAFQPGSPSRSSEQVAGIVSRVHESVAGLLKPEDKDKWRYDYPFSNPYIRNNIILHNRSRIYDLASNSLIDPVAGSVSYNDLGIVPSTVGVLLDPRFCLLTDATGYRLNNIDGSTPDAEFVNSYTNGNPGLNPSRAEFQTILVAPALDEGGNWLDVRYAPLSINDVDGLDNAIEVPSDYHLKNAATTLSINNGRGNRGGAPNLDIDGESNFGTVDIGSDEVQ